MSNTKTYDILVIGGGHAGAEAAWAGANLGARVALVTLDVAKIGVMSCNPAIGGLAKGQMVREIDALGGLMGLAADATGIQFRMLNASKGPAVRGPRCQSDKYAYAREVQRLVGSRPEIDVIAGSVEQLLIDDGRCVGAEIEIRAGVATRDASDRAGARTGANANTDSPSRLPVGTRVQLRSAAVILTTGTFMRGLMHTGADKTAGGRVGEAASVGISASLRELGFELGRLKTGTPPRLDGRTIDFAGLDLQPGDDHPLPFSDLTDLAKFPAIEQRPCHITHTCQATHDLIRDNLDRAPMYNGSFDAECGPRYCPSIEDKVVRFADRSAHHVFLEPESLETDEFYCNGISTSLPADVQDEIVRRLPGCEAATILRYGYAVEYDMVWPHQIDATGMTKRIEGLFLAGQINGTSGYEEAAGQGLIAGLNAVRYARGDTMIRFGRDESYIGVLMDDLVTKTPREPYRMFTSRAEWRLLLRSDNADQRLTPRGRELGLVDNHRWQAFEKREASRTALRESIAATKIEGQPMAAWLKRPEIDTQAMLSKLATEHEIAAAGSATQDCATHDSATHDRQSTVRIAAGVLADVQYAGYVERQRREVAKLAKRELRPLPVEFDYATIAGLRGEAAQTLNRFRPATFGQASRLAGVTPADLMVVAVTMDRRSPAGAAG